MKASEFWESMQSRGPATVRVGDMDIGEGSRVRLRPKSSADIFDLALDGQVAVVERVEQDDEGRMHLAVTLTADPGRDLGEALLPGHRFFFATDEIEPVRGDAASGVVTRVLVAGIGNVFLGDDGFGVEVVRELMRRGRAPDGVDLVDFGIRGMDLVYALQRDYRAAIFIDAAARGEPPGTLTVLDPQVADVGETTVQTHGMDPVSALRLARELGRVPGRQRVVCCEPQSVMAAGPDEDVVMELSPAVRAAVSPAADLVERLISEVIVGEDETKGGERG